MNKEQNSRNKIYATMRSLCRFAELRKLGSPEILIENERNILRKYMSDLTAEEILHISQNFNIFYEEQQKQSVIEDERLVADFAHYLHNLN